MPKLTITRGISGSGKSYWAERQNAVVIERDKIRMSLFDTESFMDEDLVTAVEDSMLAATLAAGHDVIVADTNLQPKYVKRLAKIGYDLGADVEIKEFDVSLEVALQNNRSRGVAGGRLVPADIIRKQHQRLNNTKNMRLEKPFAPVPYVPADGAEADAWLVDIDGTLAHMTTRGPFDWKRVGEDVVDPAVSAVVESLFDRGDSDIIIFSGRDGCCEWETRAWLKSNKIPFDHLYMRAAGDMRPDDIIKHELFDKHIRDKYNVIGVFDDRLRVVNMWKKMGLKVFNVSGLDNGDF